MISWCARPEDARRVTQWLCRTGMDPELSAQLGQMDPHSFTTVNTACFMSPAVLIFCTLFNPSPYNIHFSRTRSHSEKLFLELIVQLFYGDLGVSGKCGVCVFFPSTCLWRTDYKSWNHQAMFMIRARRNRFCSFWKSYHFLFTTRPWAIKF